MQLPALQGLNALEQDRLRNLVGLFLRDKSFYGAAGFIIDDWMRIRIATEASVLALHLPFDPYVGFYSILLFEGAFVVPQQTEDELGLVTETDEALVGEAQDIGPVVLSWLDIEHPEPSCNLVLHEFAHKLDAGNGLPHLRSDMSYAQWRSIFTEAFADLGLRRDQELSSHIDVYGATDPSEFFAVCTETFFMAPQSLAEQYPNLFAQLNWFYRGIPPITPP